MLKKLFISLLCLLGVWSSTALAKEVTRDEAVAAASRALSERTSLGQRQVAQVEAVNYNGKTSYYIIHYQPQGWALIAGDDMTAPLLAYSEEGTFDSDKKLENVNYWLNEYSRQIERNATQTGKREKGWEQGGYATTRAATDKISPLIQVKWNQGKPYNTYCPGSDGNKAVVGCVAVAMAQAMSVAKYPSRPNGQYSYTSPNYGTISIDYDKEEAYNWSDILSGANGKLEVARLLYHCGVSIDMNYGPDGSGTQTSYIPKALKRNFGYPNSVTFYSRSSYDGDWHALVLNELKSGRAVCYSGADLSKGYGHCFNLDGYDGSFFHVNWGWGGSNDGYFSLDALRDATMNMNYTAQQGVVVGIRAPSDAPSDIKLSNNKVKEGQPAGTVVGEVTVESEASNPTYEFSIRGEYNIIIHDYAKAPFVVEDGQLKTTEVLKSEDGDYTIEITATNKANKKSVTRQFTIHVAASGEKEELPAENVALSYNRSTKELTLNAPREVKYRLINDVDEIVNEGTIAANGTVVIALAEVNATYCILHLSNSTGSKDIKITLNQKK